MAKFINHYDQSDIIVGRLNIDSITYVDTINKEVYLPNDECITILSDKEWKEIIDYIND